MTSHGPLGVGISLPHWQAGSGGWVWNQVPLLGVVLVSLPEPRSHSAPGELATTAQRAEGLGGDS